jgi:hypothetical protein
MSTPKPSETASVLFKAGTPAARCFIPLKVRNPGEAAGTKLMLMYPHMKTNCYQTIRPGEIETHSPSRIIIKFGSALPALLLAGTVLLGPGWGVPRCAAAIVFPTSPTNEATMSAGVVQLVVDPSFAFLFAPSNTSYYPGYSPASGVLTSPMLFQAATYIGTSGLHSRNTGSYFPAPVGDPSAYPYPPTGTIVNYFQYVTIPPPFDTAPTGVDEIFTEILKMNLEGRPDSTGQSNSVCSDPRTPPEPPVGMVSVVAGSMNGFPPNRRSIGIVQRTSADSAQSFFDVFVKFTLPSVPGNASEYDFVPQNNVNGVAVLYNDDPLIVENLSISNLPPTVAYNHSPGSTAVQVKFQTSNPPYWTAGEVLGYLTLAGHGVFSNATTVTVCNRVTGPGGLLDVTLGPVGSPLPGAPIPWLRTTNSFPTPGSSYDSLVNTFVDPISGIPNINDDTVSFTDPSLGNIYTRDISLGNLQNPIEPPPYLGTNYYNPPATLAAMELSLDGLNWFPAEASGPALMTISNSTAVGSTTSTFDTEMLSLELTGGSPAIGSFMLRESPTKQSLGRHTIRQDPRGYRVSSFFDVFLELSTDGGGTWIPANRSIRLQASMPPAAPNSIYVSQIGTNVVLQWQNSFTLQSTTDLLVPFTDVKGPVTSGSYTNLMKGNAMFFRLRN